MCPCWESGPSQTDLPPPSHIVFVSFNSVFCTLHLSKKCHNLVPEACRNACYMWSLSITSFTNLKPPRIAKRITSGSICLGLSAFMKLVSRYRKNVELWGVESIRRGHLETKERKCLVWKCFVTKPDYCKDLNFSECKLDWCMSETSP